MSKDYNVFLKNADAIKSADFDFYAYSLGLQLRISPKVEDSSSFGFLQFNLRPEFLGIDRPYDSLLSGFELYRSAYDARGYDEEFNAIVRGTTASFLICISSMDSFEELIALVFSAYLCKYCGGILYDPQTDRIYSDLAEIEQKIEEEKRSLMCISSVSNLRMHNFKGWS